MKHVAPVTDSEHQEDNEHKHLHREQLDRGHQAHQLHKLEHEGLGDEVRCLEGHAAGLVCCCRSHTSLALSAESTCEWGDSRGYEWT